METMKLARPLTRGIAAVNVISLGTSILDDWSHGRRKSATARGIVFAASTASLAIPVVGWGVALGIGIADAIYGDKFYNYIENNW